MLSLRAPLFSVSLAFASGCLLGLDGVVSFGPALFLFYVTGTAWLILARFPASSLTAFYFFTAAAGLLHALLVTGTVPAFDLRRLPEVKMLETTQWRGVIVEEPVSQFTTHASRRALDRTTFGMRIDSWRPTAGRLFGADVDAPWEPASGEVRCTVIGPAKELRLGDRLEFATALEPVPPALSPGDLNLRDFEGRQGVFYYVTLAPLKWRRIATGAGDGWERLSYQARDWAYDRLQLGLEDDPRTADFLAGMLIGYRQEIPADIEQDFRRTGTIHVFAVSGQNIAEMAAVALILLQLCGLVRWRWAWLLAPIVLLYCLLTGSPASAVRATVMALAVLAAWRLGRPLNALGCWSLALLAMLVWNPVTLFDPGAQLSFGLVLALIVLAPPIVRVLVRPLSPDPFLPTELLTPWQHFEVRFWFGLMALLGTGIAAVMVSEPITALVFHQVTPISVLANLIVVPMAGLITMVGTLSVAVSLVSTTLAGMLNNSNWLLARVLILIVGFLARQPGAAVNVADPSLAGAPMPCFVVAPLRDSACLLVRTADGAWLVNTGRESAGPSTVWHLLQYHGINRLDGLVLAQMSVADNGGAEMIVRDFRPRRLVVPALGTHSPVEKLVPDLMTMNSGAGEGWQRGDTASLGSGASVEVLAPEPKTSWPLAADRGLVLLFRTGGQTLLWAGDIDTAAQHELLTARPGLRADVLVLAADQTPDAEWLRALGVRDWLQIPARDRASNGPGTGEIAGFCRVWPLAETGAVTLYFQPRGADEPATIMLRPWLSLPTR